MYIQCDQNVNQEPVIKIEQIFIYKYEIKNT